MRKRLLLSLVVIAVVAGLVGTGTWAYFSDTGTAKNTFTAGDMILEMAYEGDPYAATATWVSPPGWAPGETVTATIWLKNVGSVDAQIAYADWTNPNCGAGANLFNVIEVTGWTDSVKDFTEDFVATFVSVYDQSPKDNKLSLWELITGGDLPGVGYTPPPWDAVLYHTDPATPPPLLPAGGAPYGMRMTFKFMETAGDEYQDASCTLDLVLKATQEDLTDQTP